ncbi:hypothetical protein FACS1894125_7100 [Actinomycetota bacterium]|nr:hypothetical protein FACS1894125_7100 [Actinomycetota bacterium]
MDITKNLSIRIPWHDNGWNGEICKKPSLNVSCRTLSNIASNKNDEFEDENAGCSMFNFCANGGKNMPPCLEENGAFMSEEKLSKVVTHPYSAARTKGNTKNQNFKHLTETKLEIGRFSLQCRPFAWTNRESVEKGTNDTACLSKMFDFVYDENYESNILPWKSSWVSSGKNQKAIFDYFYKFIQPEHSLLFPYIKTVPFIEVGNSITPSVIAGIGVIEAIGELQPYETLDEYKNIEDLNNSYIWERNIRHSIREDRSNGFLFPWKKIEEYILRNKNVELNDLVVFVPSDFRREFKYSSEHVSFEATIKVLEDTIRVLKNYRDFDFGDWSKQIEWCEDKLKEIWQNRGEYPGLGAVLSAIGLDKGIDRAYEIDLNTTLFSFNELVKYSKSEGDEDVLAEFFEQKYLQFLCKFDLTVEQVNKAIEIFKNETNEFIENPYLLFEKTRLLEEKYRISINTIDSAVFPSKYIKVQNPILDSYGNLFTIDAWQRNRALAVKVLENEISTTGSLVLTNQQIRENAKYIKTDIEINLDKIDLQVKKRFKDQVIRVDALQDDKEIKVYKLVRFEEYDIEIREQISQRISRPKIEIQQDWRQLVDNQISSEVGDILISERERKSREEKTSAIKNLSSHSASVLIGGAGTGKTMW